MIGCGDGVEAGHLARARPARSAWASISWSRRARPHRARRCRAPTREGCRSGTARSTRSTATTCSSTCRSPRARSPRRAGRARAGRHRVPGHAKQVAPRGLHRWPRDHVGEGVRWNLADWGKRLTFRWTNERGAHAGFSEGELGRLLRLGVRVGGIRQPAVPSRQGTAARLAVAGHVPDRARSLPRHAVGVLPHRRVARRRRSTLGDARAQDPRAGR